MRLCGSTFNENSVSPWTRGDFRGVFERGNKPTTALRDRCRCGEGFSSLHPLRRRGFSRKSQMETNMEQHIKILGVLNIVWGAMGALGGLIVLLVFGSAFGIVGTAIHHDADAAIALPII